MNQNEFPVLICPLSNVSLVSLKFLFQSHDNTYINNRRET
jgi:hypothetical protein